MFSDLLAKLGDSPTLTGMQSKFLRIGFVSSTGGTGLTAKILI